MYPKPALRCSSQRAAVGNRDPTRVQKGKGSSWSLTAWIFDCLEFPKPVQTKHYKIHNQEGFFPCREKGRMDCFSSPHRNMTALCSALLGHITTHCRHGAGGPGCRASTGTAEEMAQGCWLLCQLRGSFSPCQNALKGSYIRVCFTVSLLGFLLSCDYLAPMNHPRLIHLPLHTCQWPSSRSNTLPIHPCRPGITFPQTSP